jgi:hypothetical protein
MSYFGKITDTVWPFKACCFARPWTTSARPPSFARGLNSDVTWVMFNGAIDFLYSILLNKKKDN